MLDVDHIVLTVLMTLHHCRYEHCTFVLNCTDPTPKSCTTAIKWPIGELVEYGPVQAPPLLTPPHGRAYFDSLER